MRNTVSMSIALAVLMSASLGCFFATSSTTVKGYVEYDNKPIEGATVTFGPTLGEATTTTGPDGKFSITAKHGPLSMLRLTVKRPRTSKELAVANREKIEFPGFWAPEEEINVEMIGIFEGTR